MMRTRGMEESNKGIHSRRGCGGEVPPDRPTLTRSSAEKLRQIITPSTLYSSWRLDCGMRFKWTFWSMVTNIEKTPHPKS